VKLRREKPCGDVEADDHVGIDLSSTVGLRPIQDVVIRFILAIVGTDLSSTVGLRLALRDPGSTLFSESDPRFMVKLSSATVWLENRLPRPSFKPALPRVFKPGVWPPGRPIYKSG
jgi:hypothetical protein